MTSQIRRSLLSIPTNIAEGFARSTNADTARFIQIATGSSSEVESLLIIASDVQFITPENVNSFIEEIVIIRKVLITLNKKLKTPVTY